MSTYGEISGFFRVIRALGYPLLLLRGLTKTTARVLPGRKEGRAVAEPMLRAPAPPGVFEESRGRQSGLVERDAQIASFFRSSSIGIGEVVDRVIANTNPAFAAMTGYTVEELVGMSTRHLYASEEEYTRVGDGLYTVRAESGTGSLTTEFVRRDGSALPVYMTVSPIDPDNPNRGFTFGAVDLSETEAITRRAEASEARFKDLFEHARDGIYIAGVDGSLFDVNAAIEQLTGFSRDELLEMNFMELLSPDSRARAEAAIAERLAGGPDDPIELELLTKSGDTCFVEATGRLVEWDDGSLRLEGIAHDVTERHLLEEQLRHKTLHDDLTGLPNRALLVDRLDQALLRSNRDQTTVVVAFLDIDDFKLVNDTHGHHAGDQVLIELASRLRAMVRGDETVARVGGDEFVIVANLDDESVVATLAERIRSVFVRPFSVASTDWRLSGSVGAVRADRSDATAGQLLQDGDIAMYAAKSEGQGGVRVFDASLRGALVHRAAIANGLRAAIDGGQITVHYQPIINPASGEILAVEALARWADPLWGRLTASDFIPIAEQNGLIIPLGRRVLDQVGRDAARWKDEHPDALPLGVFANVSAPELADPDFVAFLLETLQANDLAITDIALELTERVLVDDQQPATHATLTALGSAGVRLVLDDFGIGYSSLASLSRYPLSAVKIDRYFTRMLDRPTTDHHITDAIITLTKSLDLTVVVEGIETPAQLRTIRQHDCCAGQGFLLGQPAPASTISARLGALRPSV